MSRELSAEVPAGLLPTLAAMLHWASMKDTGHWKNWENIYPPRQSNLEMYQRCHYKQTS